MDSARRGDETSFAPMTRIESVDGKAATLCGCKDRNNVNKILNVIAKGHEARCEVN